MKDMLVLALIATLLVSGCTQNSSTDSAVSQQSASLNDSSYGASIDPCINIACNDYCYDLDTLETNGRCVNGKCIYSETRCPAGCLAHQCRSVEQEKSLTKLQTDLSKCTNLSTSFVCNAFDLSYCGSQGTVKATEYPMIGQNGFVPNNIYCRGGSAIGEKSDSMYCGLSTECKQVTDSNGRILGWMATFIGAEYGAVYQKVDGKNVYTYTLRSCTDEVELAFNTSNDCFYIAYELDNNLKIE